MIRHVTRLDRNPRELLVGALAMGTAAVCAHEFLPPEAANVTLLAVMALAIPVSRFFERKALERKTAGLLAENEPSETGEEQDTARRLQDQAER